MAGSLNRVSLIGNVGQDPEIKRLPNGNTLVNLSIATSESWKDKASGEKKEKTEWHRVVVFNDGLAKVIESYVKKGSKIFVEGKLRTRKWQDKDGGDRYSTEVVIESFGGQLILLGGGSGQGGGDTRQAEPQRPAARSNDIDTDEIPF